MRQFAEGEWQRAHRALESARQLVENDPDSAASRAYYAAFHALAAVFALRGQTYSRHSAIRAALHRDLVQTGLLGSEHGRDYDFLMDLRETGDYGGLEQVSPNSARMATRKAEAFLAAVGRLHTGLGRRADGE